MGVDHGDDDGDGDEGGDERASRWSRSPGSNADGLRVCYSAGTMKTTRLCVYVCSAPHQPTASTPLQYTREPHALRPIAVLLSPRSSRVVRQLVTSSGRLARSFGKTSLAVCRNEALGVLQWARADQRRC